MATQQITIDTLVDSVSVPLDGPDKPKYVRLACYAASHGVTDFDGEKPVK